MGLAQDLQNAAPKSNHQKCRLSKLEQDDNAKLFEARDRGLSFVALAEILTNNDIAISDSTVRKHLNRKCSCARNA